MFTGMALSVPLLVYAGLSLFIIGGPYLYMVVSIFYAYNLTVAFSRIKASVKEIIRVFCCEPYSVRSGNFV